MAVKQLSIFDNVDLEEGYKLMKQLNLGGAIEKFKTAEYNGLSKWEAFEAQQMCLEWGPLVAELESETFSRPEQFQNLWTVFGSSDNPVFKPFKRSVLKLLASKISRIPEIGKDRVIAVFDELLQYRLFTEAHSLIESFYAGQKEDDSRFFLLAQVQFRLKETKIGKINLIKACFLTPEKSFRSRIENRNLADLSAALELYQLPFVAWHEHQLPLIPLEIRPRFVNREHQTCFEFYQNLFLAEEALKNQQRASALQYRKKLKEIDEIQFRQYLETI